MQFLIINVNNHNVNLKFLHPFSKLRVFICQLNVDFMSYVCFHAGWKVKILTVSMVTNVWLASVWLTCQSKIVELTEEKIKLFKEKHIHTCT